MKIIQVNLNELDSKYESIEEIKIIPLSDIHIGDPLCDKDLLQKTINYIKEKDNVFTILNGDLINCALKNSKSDIYNDEMTPMQQMNKIVEILKPIKHKILAMTSGNHENRVYNDTSIDINAIIAKELGLEDRYDSISIYLYLYFGNKESGRKAPMVYTIYMKHGNASGKSIGSKANALIDMTDTLISDIYIMGHTHTPITTKKCIYTPDYANKSLNKKEMFYVMTNSFLNYGGYGERLGYSPTSNSIIKIKLSGRKRKVRVEI